MENFLVLKHKKDLLFQQNINNVLIIFINGVIQEPGKNYIFNGGTSFVFTKAPLPEDEVEIYFYKGVDGVDASSVIIRDQQLRLVIHFRLLVIIILKIQ